jgi:hypothetical protein
MGAKKRQGAARLAAVSCAYSQPWPRSCLDGLNPRRLADRFRDRDQPRHEAIVAV